MEPFTTTGQDANNPGHVLIVVRGKTYSVVSGTEQLVANEVATNLEQSP